MGVILTEHLTHDACALLVRFVAGVTDAHHSIQYTAMNWFESVTHIREGTGHNHRHGIVDVRGLHFLLNVDFQNSVVVKRLIHCSNLCFTY